MSRQSDVPLTAHAPAERLPLRDLRRQQAALARAGRWAALLDAVPHPVVLLNRQRQILYANDAMATLAGVRDGAALLGRRPGDVVGCVHAAETAGGCGTTLFCTTCQAVNAILASQAGRRATEECRITRNDGALDLRVDAVPLRLNGVPLTIYTIQDVSHEKRRRKLERLFFHDILNLAVGLRGFAELQAQAAAAGDSANPALMARMAAYLIEEINAQKDLAGAETHELVVRPEPLAVPALLEEVADIYRRHPVAGDRRVEVRVADAGLALVSDRILLGRTLGNLAKNALEATSPAAMVTLGADGDDRGVRFWVRNPGVMPPDVQRQVFQRSFSTKGPDRGLGTYSIKLFVEQYLHGRATFTSAAPDGTTFMVYLPRAWPADSPPGAAGARRT